MRRADREVKDRSEILRIMKDCDDVILAFNDDVAPYILAVNFGVCEEDGVITLYFHGAMEGRKYDYLHDGAVSSFQMSTNHKLIMDKECGYCTMNYESIIGHGEIIEVTEYSEKEDALEVLVQKYHLPSEKFVYARAAIPRTRVFKLCVKELTCKAKA